jgi:nucleoside-diphosphate-sugar epimerase
MARFNPSCVYPHGLQTSPDVTPLREEDAFPAQPEEGYGLEKLYAEKLCERLSRTTTRSPASTRA